MAQMVFWMLGITIAVSAMVIAAAMEGRAAHLALGLVIVVFITLSAVMAHRSATDEGKDAPRLAAILARFMGMLWAWAAIAVFITYAFILVQSQDWPGVVVVLTLGSGMCLFISNILERDAEGGQSDPKVVNFVLLIAKVQLGACCVALGGLLAYSRFVMGGPDPRWAAVNLLLCTTLGLAALSGYTIATSSAFSLPSLSKKSAAAPSRPRPRRPVARVV